MAGEPVPIDKPRRRTVPWRPPRYDPISSNFDEWLPALKHQPSAIALYIAIVRRTLGFRQKSAAIAQTVLMDATGYSKAQVNRGLDLLEECGLIQRTTKHRQLTVYEPLPTRRGKLKDGLS